MLIKEVHAKEFKRFHDLNVVDIPAAARLVVLAGPNGSGKSSLFDAFNEWDKLHGRGGTFELDYFQKKGAEAVGRPELVNVQFWEGTAPEPGADGPRLFYIRSAYRNEPDFRVDNLQRVGPVHEGGTVERLIDNDVKVSRNYHRLVSRTLSNVYDQQHDALNVAELRERLIGPLRASMRRVFGDLVLSGTGDPLQNGTFLFDKGLSQGFPYKNLSGGEKAAFDLLLDLVLKREHYNDTVYCIDEPEAHMGTRIQARLLEEIFAMVPHSCQLWVATHSIGMMRKARELQEATPDQVVFLDFTDKDFDHRIELRPAKVDRRFWTTVLNVALDDLADLVAPKRIVLCEGQEAVPGNRREPGFDADCYTKMFNTELADTAFISVGNSHDVENDRLGLGRAVEILISGSEVIRVVDRDDKSPEEILRLSPDIRVLHRRHLEAYLIDDEILSLLCGSVGKADKVAEVLAAKESAILASVGRGNPSDDMKSACPTLVASLKKLLDLTSHGAQASTFLRDTLAPLVQPGTKVYSDLKEEIFGNRRQATD